MKKDNIPFEEAIKSASIQMALKKKNIHPLYNSCNSKIHLAICNAFFKALILKTQQIDKEILRLSSEYYINDDYKGCNWLAFTSDGTRKVQFLLSSVKTSLDKNLIEYTDSLNYTGRPIKLTDNYKELLKSPLIKKILKKNLATAFNQIAMEFKRAFSTKYRAELEQYYTLIDSFNPFIFKMFDCKNGFPGIESFEKNLNTKKNSKKKLQKTNSKNS